MKSLFLFAFPLLLAEASCGKVVATVFGPKTPREQYENKIEETPEGRRWKAAAQFALQQPVSVNVPYQQKGIFPDTAFVALALEFTAKQGQKITFELGKTDSSSFVLFADLFRKEMLSEPVLLQSADTAATSFSYDIETPGTYLLRLQPGILKGGRYHLSITGGPSVGFPVADPKANIGSFWGAARDGGKRNHEGIDIFARKGSPAIAAMDGIVTGAHESGIGGKVVWLRPVGKNYTLYYAHLDSQTVSTGQIVRKGDMVGTVGNTGNARTTPAHLHFGVYTPQGPIDPLPYVDKRIQKAGAIPGKPLTGLLKVVKTKNETLKANTVLIPLGINKEGYLALQPDGRIALTPFGSVKMMPAGAAPVAGIKNINSDKSL